MFEIRSLACGYGSRIVASIPSITIYEREVIALVGRSGGGKSTILATLAGALSALGGTVSRDGEELNMRQLQEEVARTLQAFPLLHWKTVAENLSLAASIRGVEVQSIEDTLNRFSAGHLADRYPKELSGGERARSSLAQAAVSEPRLLLLDEPLTGLDPIVRQDVALSLFQFAKKADCAVVLVTHDLSEAVRFADRIVALRPQEGVSVADQIISTKDKDAIEQASKALIGDISVEAVA